MGKNSDYELSAPATDHDWDAYHEIRERVLWEARGQLGVYDRHHPDEHKTGNHPFLLSVCGEPTAVVRVDLLGETAILRRVAVREDAQRLGHGRRLLELAEQFARDHGCSQARSHVIPDAVLFYHKIGYHEVRTEPGHVLMRKDL